jgi:hypothetical protein
MAAAAGAGAALWATFALWSGTSALAFPRFVLGVIVLFLLPGSFLIRALRLQTSSIEHMTLGIALGMVTTCALYAIASAYTVSMLVWAWILAALLAFPWRNAALRACTHSAAAPDSSHFLLLAALMAAWTPLCLLTFYFPNLAPVAGGGVAYVAIPDVLLHTSVAAELTHTFPPQAPFMAGAYLSYHVGMDLVAAVLHRYGGIGIPDLVVRFCPVLFVTLAVLSVFCLGRRLIGSGAAAVAAAFLAILGEDLSFIPGLLRGSEEIWSAHFFSAPTVFSLYYFNPMVLAFGLLFMSLFCVQRSLAQAEGGWIVAAAICAAALIQSKIFAFVHLALALGATVTLNVVLLRRWTLLRQAAGIALFSAPLMLYTLLANRGGGEIVWVLASGLNTYVKPAFRAAGWPLLAAYPVIGLILYVVMTYGFRGFCASRVASALRQPSRDAFYLLLGLFVIIGPLVSLASKIVPRDDRAGYNNGIWFLVQSKYVATVLAVGVLAAFWRTLGLRGRGALIVAVAGMSLPSTIDYVLKSRPPLSTFPRAVIETIGVLNREARPGDVVMSRLEEAILALTPFRVPFFPVYEDSFARREAIEIRRADMQDFWAAWEHGRVRADVLEKYRAQWIVAARGSPGPVPSEQQGERLFVRLDPLPGSGAYVIYRVLRAGSARAP